jgi:serine/threonine protein kinase
VTVNPKKQPIPFGKYLLLDRINIGGMAEVWRGKAYAPGGFERLVAIKRILPNIAEDDEFVSMFLDEAKISVQLTHVNIAQIYDLGQNNSSYFIAMEHISGRDCRAIFDRCKKRGEPAPLALSCHVIAQMADGLDYAHRKIDGRGEEMHIVHRDVSPQNVLISYEGEVKVIDFGIAKAAGKVNRTQAGILKGKFAYMSPEQVRGLEIDRRADIFAIGICLFEMLTGERLFVGDTDFAVLEKVRNGQVPRPTTINPKIPQALERIVLKSLAPDREHRYQYASELSEELKKFLASTGEEFGQAELAEYMRETFADELAKENDRLRELDELQPPEGFLEAIANMPVPVRKTSASNPALAVAPPPAPPPEIGLGDDEEAGATMLIEPDLVKVALARADALDDVEEKTTPSVDQMKMAPGPPMLMPLPEGAAPVEGSPLQLLRSPDPEVTDPNGTPHLDHGESTDTDVSGKLKLEANIATEQRPAPAPPRLEVIPPQLVAPREPEPKPYKPPTIAELERPSASRSPALQVDKRVWMALGAAVLLIASVVGIVAATRETPQGYVLLDVPTAARAHVQVMVAGKDLGTPAQWPVLERVMAGKAMVMVRAEGYAPFARTVDVAPGEVPANVQAELEPLNPIAKLVVVADPETAEVRLNDKVIKKEGAPGFALAQLTVGQINRLEVRRQGFVTLNDTVIARKNGETVTVKPKLDALEQSVDVTSMPAGAQVIVNRASLGTTPARVKLVGVVKTISLHKRCYADAVIDVPPPSSRGPASLHADLVKQPHCR